MLAQLVAAAVIGALSPVAALSTIMLLGSGRPVANTVACLVGWTVVLLALAAGLLALLSGHQGASGKSAKAAVELVVGLMLLCVALRSLVGEHHPLADPTPETPHWMARLEHVRPGQALLIGMVLIAISPADLAAYFSALQALIGESDGAARVVIWVVLVLCIDSCILIPLGVYLAFPQRAVTGGSAGVCGVLLLGQGIAALA
jgi:hypothetical protein